MKYVFSNGEMLIANAACPRITPNIQKHRIALIERKSLDSSVFEPESDVNLYQFRGNEKLTSNGETGKNFNR